METIATMEIGKNNSIINKKSNNTNNNGNNDDNVRFLMTKTLILMIMEELVIITIATVIKLTYGRNSMGKTQKQTKGQKKPPKQTYIQSNKLDLIKKLIR